jgi:hypothetical protein
MRPNRFFLKDNPRLRGVCYWHQSFHMYIAVMPYSMRSKGYVFCRHFPRLCTHFLGTIQYCKNRYNLHPIHFPFGSCLLFAKGCRNSHLFKGQSSNNMLNFLMNWLRGFEMQSHASRYSTPFGPFFPLAILISYTKNLVHKGRRYPLLRKRNRGDDERTLAHMSSKRYRKKILNTQGSIVNFFWFTIIPWACFCLFSQSIWFGEYWMLRNHAV